MGWVAEQLLSKAGRATQSAPSALAALESVFIAHIDFIAAHPGVPRMLFSELQRAEDTTAKLKVRILLEKYAHLLKELLKTGKQQGKLVSGLDLSSAVTAFIGIIQWMAVQSLLTDESQWLHEAAPKVLATYRRGIESAERELPETTWALKSQYETEACMGSLKRYLKTPSAPCLCPAESISKRSFSQKAEKMAQLSVLIVLIMPDHDAGELLQKYLPCEEIRATPGRNNVFSASDALRQIPVDLVLGVPPVAGLDWRTLLKLSHLDAITISDVVR